MITISSPLTNWYIILTWIQCLHGRQIFIFFSFEFFFFCQFRFVHNFNIFIIIIFDDDMARWVSEREREKERLTYNPHGKNMICRLCIIFSHSWWTRNNNINNWLIQKKCREKNSAKFSEIGLLERKIFLTYVTKT